MTVTDVTGNMDDYAELFAEPRTVKPRARTYKHLPVIAVSGNDVLIERGEVRTLAQLIGALPKLPPRLFVTVNAADFVAELDKTFAPQYPDRWQWRASVHERDICRPDGVRIAARVSTAIHFFGFKSKGGNAPGGYHKIIDPITMYGRKLDEIWPTEVTVVDDPHWRQLKKLLTWGVALRDFCHANEIDVRPTTGSISAQFMTDRRFYRKPRRQVPVSINERVRDHLPGNYYQLNVSPAPNADWRAYYLDQTRAHHYHARTTPLPDSDHLYAFGRFLDLDAIAFPEPWPDFYGLYCLDLLPPRKADYEWLTKAEHGWFVYSNELPHLLDNGYKVLGVRAAWGSRIRDKGIPKFARWAVQQLDAYDDAPWLKPLLLATYGILAAKPRHAEAVFKLASKGEDVSIHTGKNVLNGKRTRGLVKLTPRIANVLHRGMIEAATRSESIGLAQFLAWKNFRVLSIYADAVIVEQDDDKPLPVLPEPWRNKQTLTHLQFINQQAFISGEMTKLPGVTGELRRYSRRGKAPRLPNVAELMEHEEAVNAMLSHSTTKD